MPTASGSYATLANVKARMAQSGVTFGTNDDTILTTLCNQTNGWIEGKTGRVIAPITYTNALFDGFDALEDGKLLVFPRGLRSVSLLEIAPFTGGTFATVPPSDYFIQPESNNRDPGWPGTELWLTNIPSASNASPVFFPGWQNVRLTGTGGWAAIPDEIAGLAEKLVVAAYRARASGGGGSVVIGSDGSRVIERSLDAQDWHLVNSYTYKEVELI